MRPTKACRRPWSPAEPNLALTELITTTCSNWSSTSPFFFLFIPYLPAYCAAPVPCESGRHCTIQTIEYTITDVGCRSASSTVLRADRECPSLAPILLNPGLPLPPLASAPPPSLPFTTRPFSLAARLQLAIPVSVTRQLLASLVRPSAAEPV